MMRELYEQKETITSNNADTIGITPFKQPLVNNNNAASDRKMMCVKVHVLGT